MVTFLQFVLFVAAVAVMFRGAWLFITGRFFIGAGLAPLGGGVAQNLIGGHGGGNGYVVTGIVLLAIWVFTMWRRVRTAHLAQVAQAAITQREAAESEAW